MKVLGNMRQKKRLYMWLALGLACALAVGIGIFLVIANRRDADDQLKKSLASNCVIDDAGVLAQSAVYKSGEITSEQADQLISKVQAVGGFEQSINCQYVLAYTHSSTGRIEQSVKYYEQVLKLNDDGYGWIDPAISEYSVDDMRKLKDFFAEQSKQIKQNVEQQRIITPKDWE